jgi:Ca2+-binding RTX toxin-like protein
MPVYPPTFTSQQIADQLTRDGEHWTSSTITYSFNNSSTLGNSLDTSFQSWVNLAVQTVEEVLGIDFQLVSGPGNITINGSRNDGTYATTRFGANGVITSASIFFDQSWDTNASSSLSYGSYGFLTIIHELLHTLGLSHPGNYNGSGNYFTDALFLQDTHRYSVMSYFDADFDGSGTSHWLKVNGQWEWQYPQTPMVYDMLALSDGNFGGTFSGYNLNPATRAGDTTYGYNATSGINSLFNFAANDGPVLTIYDANGNDTLDLSGDTVGTKRIVTYDTAGTPAYTEGTRTTSVIDLTPGSYSSTHGMLNNIGVAFGTLIENAIGTGFNDAITGNSLGNILFGGGGSDTINGGLGGDFLIGGSAADILTGGQGVDWFAFASGVVDGDIVTDYAAGDYLYFGGALGSTANFSISGSNVIADGVTLTGATAGDVSAITQASSALLDPSRIATTTLFWSGGLLGMFGTYSVTTFDANSNDTWRTITSGYDGISQLDYTLTSYDAGQYYSAIFADFDQQSTNSWNQYYTYYASTGPVDLYWIYYDAGQPFGSALLDVDQAGGQTWSQQYNYYTTSSQLDIVWTYFDPGQTYAYVAVDSDQTNSNYWSQYYTCFTSSSAVDIYWIYYDAGAAYSFVSIDYDQANNQTWSQAYTYYALSGQADLNWTYFDAGQPLQARLTDYDQANAYSWSQHIVEYGASGNIVNDYYI